MVRRAGSECAATLADVGAARGGGLGGRPGRRRRATPAPPLAPGDGSTGSGAAILTARLTRREALDRSFGNAGNGRVVAPGGSSGNDTPSGAAAGPAV